MSYNHFLYRAKDGQLQNEEFHIEEPRKCMHCNTAGIQLELGHFITNGNNDKYNGVALYTCQLCLSTTIHFLIRFGERFDTTFEPVNSLPEEKQDLPEITTHIQDEFPSFFEIYNQSAQAEKASLDQIAGMGYRKALEFLVTDYLLVYPVEDVKEDWLINPKTSLSQKISKIPSQRIQKLARAISFLGNDETHYTRQHPEHDIQSIKAFIRALVSEIQNEIEFQKAEELISKPKP